MKLLFVADELKCGGAERHLVTLAAALARHGHDVLVACLKPEGELAPQLEQGAVRLVCCASRGGLDIAALARLAAVLDHERPRLIVATSQYAQMYATLARLGARHRPPLGFICHSMGVVQRGRAARLRFLVYRQFYRQADCVVFVSAVQRNYFAQKNLGLRRAEVIHNGIDLRHFAPDQVQCAVPLLRARYGLTRADLVVGMCAALREEKRQVDLLEALARLRALGLPVKAVLVGDGPMRPAIEAATGRLGLRGNVILPGFQDDVRPFIGMCDVMALTSHAETFPIATLEYMALGKALVSSNVGGIGEQIVDERNGLLYPAGDIDALTAALARLANPGLRARLGQGALADVRARFGQGRMLARYQTLFHELARQHAAARVGA